MASLSRYIARKIWGLALHSLRRPRVKRLRRNSPNLFPAPFRDRARQSMIAQDRWARRHGVFLIAATINIVFASVAITYTYLAVLWLHDNGFLSGRQTIQQSANR